MLKSGLYEQIINKEIENELEQGAHTHIIDKAEIDPEEASLVISKYITDVLKKGLERINDNSEEGPLDQQINLANRLINLIKDETTSTDFEQYLIHEKAEQLLAFMNKENTVHAVLDEKHIIRPDTSLVESSLFTGAPHEPSMYSELRKEILSSDRIDMLVSFIKWSGLRLILDELKSFTNRGGQLRIITTTYMGATDYKAIEELSKLNNTQVKVSYDAKHTRLHAKTYVFNRQTGFSTTYIGSSNISNAALTSGLEWNVKVTEKGLPDTYDKIQATFESYWLSEEFEEYHHDREEDSLRLRETLDVEKGIITIEEGSFLFDIKPYPYQQEILDRLDAERRLRNHYKNLVVAPTGVGKTVIAALDYKRFCQENPKRPNRLLFVAHREEILKQSISCFRSILKDPNFGDLFVGEHKPSQIEHLFISIQTLNSAKLLEKTATDFYEVVIVDEFHHAAADSYQDLLSYYQPTILLGLTATPERMDEKPILHYFEDRVAAEMRLAEAIDRKLLSPFQYFGVSDIVDLSDLVWSRGGYQVSDLSKIYTGNDLRSHLIVKAIHRYVADINETKGLGFCVSKEHAKYMADFFNRRNIPSINLDSDSSDEVRGNAQKRLLQGDIKFIFTVNLYNEGVDIPAVNTVLFLRPTESLTIFLQQLGRGLRLAEGKDCLTVLDFVGQANKKYNFEEKLNALTSRSRRGIQGEIKSGFPNLPKGCFIKLEKKAQEYILDNIKKYFGTRQGLVNKISSFEEDSGLELNLLHLINYYHMDIRDLYRFASFSRLRVEAGVSKDFTEDNEEFFTKAFAKLCSIDSRRWIDFLLDVFTGKKAIGENDLNGYEHRMLNMFWYTFWHKPSEAILKKSHTARLDILKQSPTLFCELKELLNFCYDQIDFIDEDVEVGFECPLDLHCNYTRDQILVAMDCFNPWTVMTGVRQFREKNLDVLFVTLNKSEKEYSPQTMYKDYSVNEMLFHWQSQHSTGEESHTGQRYIQHKNRNYRILLFVRENKTDAVGAGLYTYLGRVNYQSHQGSKPMNILWSLDKPIPAKFIKKTNKLISG